MADFRNLTTHKLIDKYLINPNPEPENKRRKVQSSNNGYSSKTAKNENGSNKNFINFQIHNVSYFTGKKQECDALEREVHYQEFDFSNFKTDLSSARVRREGETKSNSLGDSSLGKSSGADKAQSYLFETHHSEKLAHVKECLAVEKTKIDAYQLNMQKHELKGKFGTTDVETILNNFKSSGKSSSSSSSTFSKDAKNVEESDAQKELLLKAPMPYKPLYDNTKDGRAGPSKNKANTGDVVTMHTILNIPNTNTTDNDGDVAMGGENGKSTSSPKNSNSVDLSKIEIPHDMVPRMLVDAFYAKLTDRIYLMNFKPRLMKQFDVKHFSNAGLKITEVLFKEDFVNTKSRTLINNSNDFSNPTNSTLKHFGNCELPGSFIVALKYHISLFHNNIKHYDWIGNSLLPRNEVADSDGLPDYYDLYKDFPKRWLMGDQKQIHRSQSKEIASDNVEMSSPASPSEESFFMDGDILKFENLDFIRGAFYVDSEKCDIYTSDAGIMLDVDEYNFQEQVETRLKLGEILSALYSLKPGGNFLVKHYTFFEKITVDAWLLLSSLFEELKVVKPITSKPTNSEVYLIGKNFLKVGKNNDSNINSNPNPNSSSMEVDSASSIPKTYDAIPSLRINLEHTPPTAASNLTGFTLAKHRVSITTTSKTENSQNCAPAGVSEEELERVLDLYMEKIITHDLDESSKRKNNIENSKNPASENVQVNRREDLGFLDNSMIARSDLEKFELAAQRVYLKQVLFIHRNLFYTERFLPHLKIYSNQQYHKGSIEQIVKLCRGKIWGEVKKIIETYFNKYVTDYKFRKGKLRDLYD